MTENSNLNRIKDSVLRNASENEFENPELIKIRDEIKIALDKQNSDEALRIITIWALNLGSSDMHFDNSEEDIKVRFRIDWVLVDCFSLSKKEYKLVLERMKYSASLKLNISNVPQDWKYSLDNNWNKLDIRLSTLPVKYGENMVCRILDSTKAIVDFDSLWFFWTSKRLIEKAISKKNGLILVTWPTGSWKTTTLYTILKEISTRDKKAITLEDPIEYELESVIQSEINEKNGYTYADWLKALLRQDPDIIMIWEIRNFETLDISANASLTGHLVLSTLHTKSATETLERMINMWLKPYIIAWALDTIIAQRLVRKICPHCREEVEKTGWEKQAIDILLKDIDMNWIKSENVKIFKWKWCEHCNQTWYKWRVGIFEILSLSSILREMIREWAPSEELIEEAKKHDFISMKQDWILKAMKWTTTIEEVLRVI